MKSKVNLGYTQSRMPENLINYIKVNVYRFAPVFIWMGVIFGFSSIASIPGAQIIWWDFVIKKTAHMVVFGILFYLLVRADNWSREDKRYWLAFGLTFLYAVSDEWHQSFVPGRHARWYDVVFDLLGASIVYEGYFRRRFLKKIWNRDE